MKIEKKQNTLLLLNIIHAMRYSWMLLDHFRGFQYAQNRKVALPLHKKNWSVNLMLGFHQMKQMRKSCPTEARMYVTLNLATNITQFFFFVSFTRCCRAETQALQRQLATMSERFSQKCVELYQAEQKNAKREKEIGRKERDVMQLRKENLVSQLQIAKV